MKKLFIILFSLLLIFGFAGCSTQVEYEFYKGDYVSVPFTFPSGKTDYCIVSDYSELACAMGPGIKEYSQDFFDDHTLIVIKDYYAERLEECNIYKVSKKANKIIISMEVGYKYEISSGQYVWENYVYVELKTKNIKEVEIIYTEINE